MICLRIDINDMRSEIRRLRLRIPLMMLLYRDLGVHIEFYADIASLLFDAKLLVSSNLINRFNNSNEI